MSGFPTDCLGREHHYRSDADALGEAVVGLDVSVQLGDGLFSQRAAVMGFVHVQHHCGETRTQSRHS